MTTQQPTSSGKRLIAYFYSGWAFFIPYLLTYLLYLWQKWPANGFAPSALGNGGHIPALLHVYWALHAIHAVLAVIALRSWWKAGPGQTSPGDPIPAVVSSKVDVLYAVAPWLLLALIFFIPGVYLEWPADPWEHLRRITEWSVHPIVSMHSAGYKSFYFFAYSFITVPPNLSLLGDVNIYGTCIDLLLAWQYYRLAMAVGLDPKWSFLSVSVNALTLGNVCFSFYKYYALASTMYAQLGAVAMVRITIDFFQRSKTQNDRDPAFDWLRLSRPIAGWGICLALLSALVACNHIQGIGIAGLGIGSIIVWRLLDWKRSAGWWLIAMAAILSVATILWWPRNPIIDTFYRPTGWLNAWYGFNLFAWPSPAADRALQIVGVLGLINLSAGTWLAVHKHPAGWLIAGPIIALMLPFVALPLADSLGASNPNYIITFQRMLFAIPSGLGVMICAREWLSKRERDINRANRAGLAITLVALTIILSSTPNAPGYGRSWHLLTSAPEDLQLKPVIPLAKLARTRAMARPDFRLLTTDASAHTLNTFIPGYFPFHPRPAVFQPEIDSTDHAIAIVRYTWAVFVPKVSILNRDPLIAHSSAWITLAGSPPQFIANVENFSGGLTALQNQAGLRSDVFTSDLIPIEETQTYQVEFSVRQCVGASATAYLTVAWYDQNGTFLPSDQPTPLGAGSPAGWANGTYSYFGLVNASPSKVWTTYRTSFGPGEAAIIPSQARFVRLGALLNYNQTPAAVIQLTNIRLWKKAEAKPTADGTFPLEGYLLVICPSGRGILSPSSQAAFASRHWAANQVALDLGGTHELRQAAIAAGGRPVDDKSLVWELH